MPSMSKVELYAAIRRASPCTVFASGGQEAFLEGHEHAFRPDSASSRLS